MAKAEKKSAWQVERDKREALAQWHRDELPGNGADEIGELIEAFGLTIEAYHQAALKNDEKGMVNSYARARAAVANYWGSPPGLEYDGPRDTFDCWASAAKHLSQQVAAPDGEVPMYGQRGRFMLDIAGCRVDFHYDGLFGICGGAGYVIDIEKPFISETGFRSFQVCPYDHLLWTGGLPVDEYMRRVCTAQLNGGDKKLKEPRLVMVDGKPLGRENPIGRHQWIRNQRAKDPAWWSDGFLSSLPGLSAAGFAVREERTGQLSLMF